MNVEIENTYYEGEENIKQNPREAIELFDKVVELEAPKPVKWSVLFICLFIPISVA